MMNIGCLGWGSLVWNPGTLRIRNGWFQDGPLLPVEFARHSGGNRITLVLVPTVQSVRALWCVLVANDLQTAIDELATRESVVKSKGRSIGSWCRTGGATGPFTDPIGAWAITRQLDAVVWTNLGPKWQESEGRMPSANEVLDFVRRQGSESEAADYVRKAPEQIDTEYRRRMLEDIPWLRAQAG